MKAGWEVKELGAVSAINYGYTESASSEPVGPRFLRITDIQDDRVDWENVPYCKIESADLSKYRLASGDIVFVRTGATTGKSFLVNEPPDAVFASYLIRLRLLDKKLLPEFVSLFFQTYGYWKSIKDGSVGSAQGGFNATKLSALSIPIPPLPEQRKIAAILSTWDEALEKLDALIAAKDRRKQALIQQLLTGQKRVKGFSGKWRTQELGSAVTPISRPVPKPVEPFLAAGIRSHGKGVFLKPDFKPSEIALDELFQLRTNDLVVNITFAWEGALAIVPPEANGALVSHRFPAFRCVDGKTALGFIRHLVRTKHFVFSCGLSSPGGAGRNRVLSKTSFLKIVVSMPSFPEQTEIAAILDTCDEELRILRTQRVALDQQKRGLMQRLLTGRVRVHPEKESQHA
jgi:type I restriction enzyme S subunit